MHGQVAFQSASQDSRRLMPYWKKQCNEMQAASKTVVGGRKLLCFGMCSQVDGLLQASE